MVEEIWKPIKGYEGLYEISNWGRVKSLNYHHIGKTKLLKTGKNTSGYLVVNLCKNGKKKMFSVHRLVAETFLPPPDNLPEVNHKDEDKTNNSVENLEWISHKDNCNHGTRNERTSKAKTNGKLSKPVLQFTKNGEFIREWPSMSECMRNGFQQGNICKCCNGKLKSAYGYIWRYKEDYS